MIKRPAPRFDTIVKMIVDDQLDAKQMSNWCTGVVSKVNPLEITINQKNIIPAQYLILTNAVKDHDVDITVSWNTEEDTHKHGNGNNGQPTADVTHKHGVSGRKKITIHNGLTVGENVLLLRETGGQRYVVLDRTSTLKTTGESV